MKKKDLSTLETYNRYYGRTLDECYTTCSSAKAVSFRHIREEMESLDGWGLTVLSYNTFMYTCAYKYYNEELDREILVLHTPSKRTEISLD